MSDNLNRFLNLVRTLSYEKRDITLASGRKSDFYIDMKNTLLHPEGISLAAVMILEKLKDLDGELTAVGGVSIGADPLATACSMKSLTWKKPLMAFYIRKEPKGHGTEQWIEGLKNIPSQSSVYILEDVVTTGGSSLKATQRALNAGLKVKGIISCVDREEGGRQMIEEKGFTFKTILTKSQILGNL